MGAWPNEPKVIRDINFWQNGQLCCGEKLQQPRNDDKVYCTFPAMKNGCCRRHGGKLSGAKTARGRANSKGNHRKYGLFANSPTDGELPLLAEFIEANTLEAIEAAIADVLLQLQRVTNARRDVAEGTVEDSRLIRETVEQEIERVAVVEDGIERIENRVKSSKTRREKGSADLDKLYQSHMRTFERLVRTKWLLTSGDDPDADPFEKAAAIKQTLHEMVARTKAKRIKTAASNGNGHSNGNGNQ